MTKPSTLIFLLFATLFAAVHWFAVETYSYWAFWWLDIIMHFWGGLLIGLGIHVLSTFSRISFKPTYVIVLIVLAVITSSWEVFEFVAKVYQPDLYLIDTVIDVVLGFSGGLLAHTVLRRYTMV